MPVVCGEQVVSVDAIVDVFRRYGDRVRGIYRARYRYDVTARDPYSGVQLERPPSLADDSSRTPYPWEQIYTAAAACIGSDYPMLAAHFGVPVDSLEFVVEGEFDPRGQFDGLGGYTAPADARYCFRSLVLRARLASSAPRKAVEALHEHVLAHNMVLGALRGIPQTNELVVDSVAEDPARAAR